MPTLRQRILYFAPLFLVAASSAFAQPLIDDRFDDGDVTTNTTGIGTGWNPSLGGAVTEEANGIFSVEFQSGASSNAMLSKEIFSANQSDTIYGTWTFTEIAKPLGPNAFSGTTNFHMGFIDINETFDAESGERDDGFDAITNPIRETGVFESNRAGLWLSFRAREDRVDGYTGELAGDEGLFVYQPVDAPPVLLGQWTWDRSLFEFDESAIATDTSRSDRLPIDLIVPDLSAEISSDDTGYSLRFFTSDPNAIVPEPISGTWADAGVTDLSPLGSVRAVGIAGQNGGPAEGEYPTIELDRFYLDNAPQRDADNSGLVYTWGSRPNNDGNWSDTDGWQVGGVDTATIPDVVIASRSADAVEVVSGIVRVANDQAAWSAQVSFDATLAVESGNTLQIFDNEFGDATDIQAGGNLVLGGTLMTPDINVDGTVIFTNGTLRTDSGTIRAILTTGGGTISNDDEVTIGRVTLISGDTLTKRRSGTLILDQSAGTNSFAAGSRISIESGTLAAVNDDISNTLGGVVADLDGGTLQLSAGEPNSVAFDTPVSVITTGTIRAGQASGSLANQSVTLGGTNGLFLAFDAVASLETTDGYSLDIAGPVIGLGTLSVADGANVNLSGGVTPAVLEFQGDTSQVTVGPTAIPTVAYQFRPHANTPAMSIDFQLTSSAGVVINENDDVTTGSVRLNNSSNNYTGTTRIVSGTLVPEALGPLTGDYDGNGAVESADYSAWKANFGGSVTPGSGADGNGDGQIDLADYTIWRNNLGATSSGLSATSLLQFEGSDRNKAAVLQTSRDFERNIGTDPGEVYWDRSGGFAAAGGGTVNVTLEGGSQLTWSSANAGFNGQSLKLGSPTADGTIVITNDINLNNSVRTIELIDNQSTLTDVSEISGVISGGGGETLLVTGKTSEFDNGHLRLSGANTFARLEISMGTVEAEDGVGLPANANLRFFPQSNRDDPAIFATSGTFERNIGSGPGEVYWVSSSNGSAGISGGFAAVGGDLTVTLEGGATLTPSARNRGFNNGNSEAGTLQLGSPVADGVVTFTNSTEGQAGGTDSQRVMFFETFDNPLTDTDGVVISGNHTNLNIFRIDGDGPVEVSGTVETSNATFVNNAGIGFLNLNITGDITADNNLTAEVSSEVNVFINGTASVDNNLQARALSGIGGSGTAFMTDTDGDGVGNQTFQVQNTGFLRPGADLDTVGTLTIDMTLAASDTTAALTRLQNGSRFELEFENNGGSIDNDVLAVTSSNGFPDLLLGEAADQVWYLELDALNDLSGLISSSDEFDFITFDGNVDVGVNGVIFNTVGAGTGVIDNVIIESTEFDVSGASVEYEVFNDFSGRIFVSGLTLLSGSTTAVPEPSTSALAILLIAATALRIRCLTRYQA